MKTTTSLLSEYVIRINKTSLWEIFLLNIYISALKRNLRKKRKNKRNHYYNTTPVKSAKMNASGTAIII